MQPFAVRRLVALLALTCFILTPKLAAAEFMYFARGGSAQAPARVDGQTVTVETPSGDVAFLVSDFKAIVPGGCPSREWPSRLDAARKADPASRFKAVWWALQNGLIPETVAAIREFARLDSEFAPMIRLARVLDRLDQPTTDPDSAALRTALGVSCESLAGPHVLLLHQHDAKTARARLDLLERVVLAYHLWLAGLGVDVDVPSQRLVSVYLADHAAYLAFLNARNAGAFRSTLGYYDPGFKAVICHDPRSSPTTPPVRPNNSSDMARRRLLREFDMLARDHGTAAHELIHLLVAETHLEPHTGAFPHWLHEGLAAQFEVVRGGRWAGISRVHDLRLPDLRRAEDSLNLANLVLDSGFGRGYRPELYARSWALVFFLRQTRPQEFVDFLHLIRVPESSNDSDPRLRIEEAFRSAFSRTPASLEPEWALFLKSLSTPLNGHPVTSFREP